MNDYGLNIAGTGRWLVVRNNKAGTITFRHPATNRDTDKDLVLTGFEEKVLEDGESWLSVPWFVSNVNGGRVTLYRSDDLPSSAFTRGSVMPALLMKFPANVAAVIYEICSTDPLPGVLDQYIELEPNKEVAARFGATHVTGRWDLVEDHLPFLRAILELESFCRKRKRLMARIKKRIAEIRAIV